MTLLSKSTGGRTVAAWDIEIYKNYFFLGIKRNDAKGTGGSFELTGKNDSLDLAQRQAIINFLETEWTCSFNGNKFDLPILNYALAGATVLEMKEMSNKLIEDRVMPWIFLNSVGVDSTWYPKHVDLIDLVPGFSGLKELGCRLHYPHLENLPVDPNEEVTPEQARGLAEYCIIDCDVTLKLFEVIKKEIALRRDLRKSGLVDLGNWWEERILSIGAPKLAELAFKRKYAKKLPSGKAFEVPAMVEYKKPPIWTAEMAKEHPATDAILEKFVGTYVLNPDTGYLMDYNTDGFELDSTYRSPLPCEKLQFGTGGLHSIEAPGCITAESGEVLCEIDAASFYPHLLLGSGSLLDCKPPEFGDRYAALMRKRLQAKEEGDKTTDVVLKLLLNSAYGKMGSQWSFIYNPEVRLAVCMSGQALLHLLIEVLHNTGTLTRVISVNTDGILAGFKRETDVGQQVQKWTDITGIPCSVDYVEARWRKSVNSYLQLNTDKSVKRKGEFCVAPAITDLQKLSHCPYYDVCTYAVSEYFLNGTAVETTLEACKKMPHLWVAVRKSKHGAAWFKEELKGVTMEDVSEKMIEHAPLGKVARWYVGGKSPGFIYSTHPENHLGLVAGASNCTLAMDVTDGEELPDLDCEFYANRCHAMIHEIETGKEQADARTPGGLGEDYVEFKPR